MRQQPKRRNGRVNIEPRRETDGHQHGDEFISGKLHHASILAAPIRIEDSFGPKELPGKPVRAARRL